MRRLRIALLLVALGLAVPVALLYWRALDGVALERSVRHEAVAARAFDEMERLLSGLLDEEEERPFDHYGFYLAADPAAPRSPLSALPGRPFVVGYFQIDPDGSVHTPLRPRNVTAARARGDWPAPAEVERAIERTEGLVAGYWHRAGAERAAGAAAPAPSQAPGTTVDLGKAGERADEEPAAAPPRAPEQEVDEGYTAYRALDRLNLGADRRARRKQKVIRVPTAEANEAPPSEGAVARDRAVASSDAYAGRLSSLGYLEQQREVSFADDDFARRPGAELETAHEPGEAEAREEGMLLAEKRAPAAVVRVALDPMVGRTIDAQHLLLYRTVLAGQQGYRQGLLVERAGLGRWLEQEVIERAGLAGVARVSFPPVAAFGDGDPGAGFVYQHRFAEPFDALAVRLALTPLEGVGSPTTLYWLGALLLLVGAAGLLAVYRMVAVRVDFAERRNNFVAAVSHELKTPLTAIRMYGEMLRDGLVGSDAKRDEYHRTITDESERLSRLIDNVLELSRLEKGNRELRLAAGSVAPVLEEVAEKLRPHARSQGFALDLEIEPGLPAVRFDRDALLQVLFNLVDNAMKYARAAEQRQVVLEARREAGGVAVAVRDHGPGVAPRHLARIFQPFYRGEEELTRTTQGTGIGLALVKELAERMGAAVRAANATGGGFRVAIAFRPAE
jgi:signal transduction histidine kinase